MNKEERTTCLVPTRMLPNEKAFTDLGFTFEIFPMLSDPGLCLATLPKGWKSVGNKGLTRFVVTLFDEKDCERGSYVYQPHIAVDHHFMTLKPRFLISIDFDPYDSTYSTLCIFVRDKTNGKILFSAGSFSIKDPRKYFALIPQAEDFLNVHYPNWEDPTKYWDLEEDAIEYWQPEK